MHLCCRATGSGAQSPLPARAGRGHGPGRARCCAPPSRNSPAEGPGRSSAVPPEGRWRPHRTMLGITSARPRPRRAAWPGPVVGQPDRDQMAVMSQIARRAGHSRRTHNCDCNRSTHGHRGTSVLDGSRDRHGRVRHSLRHAWHRPAGDQDPSFRPRAQESGHPTASERRSRCSPTVTTGLRPRPIAMAAPEFDRPRPRVSGRSASTSHVWTAVASSLP